MASEKADDAGTEMSTVSQKANYVRGVPSDVRIAYGRANEMPSGAFMIPLDEVKAMQMRAITAWKPSYEMWPLKYGSAMVGASSLVCGLLMHYHFRRKFLVGSLLRLPANILVSLPSFFPITLMHEMKVTDPVRLQLSSCKLCDQVRSGCLQVACGALVPAMFGVLVACATAHMGETYNLPRYSPERGVQRHAAATLRFMGRQLVESRHLVLGFCVAQFFLGEAIAYAEMATTEKLNAKLRKDLADASAS